MKIEKINAGDLPREPSADTLFLIELAQDDDNALKTCEETAKQTPLAIVFTDNEVYKKALESREAHPSIFLLKPDFNETLVLTLAEQFAKAQDGSLPKELLQQYIVSLMDKLYTLSDLIHADTPPEEKQEGIKKAVHKLAGNTGTYGYSATSKMCKEFELHLTDNKVGEIGPFEEFFGKLCESFKEITPTAPPASEPPQGGETKAEQEVQPETSPQPDNADNLQKSATDTLDLLIVDDDADLTNLLKSSLEANGYKVQAFNDFQKAKEEILNIEAKIVLLDVESGQELSGFDLAQLFIDNPEKKAQRLIGFLTAKVSIEDRMKAAPYSPDLYLEKPLNMDYILLYFSCLLYTSDAADERLLKETVIPTPLRILLVDDDEDFCKQVVAQNKEGAFEVMAKNTLDDLFSQLITLDPHLVLIDYELGDIKGSALVQVLRADIRYRNTPIMIVSGKEDPEMFREVLGAGIEGFVSKPITGEGIHKIAEAFFRKTAFIEYLEKTNPTYGIFTRRELQHIFDTTRPLAQNMCAALFTLSYSSEQEADKAPIRQEFINRLKTQFSKNFSIGLWEADQVALLTTNYTVNRLQLILEEFFGEGMPENLTVSATYASTIEGGGSLDEVIAGATERQSNRVMLFEDAEVEVTANKEKNALFICADQELNPLIEFALQKSNITPAIFEAGTDGYQWLKERLFKDEPNVIIMDFDLPYENGPILLEKMANLVGNSIPIVVLSQTNLSSILFDIMEKGILTFIRKPFNLQHFVNTVLRATTK